MSKKFSILTRQNMRDLVPGDKLHEHGIIFERLSNGDGRFSVNIMADGARIHRAIGLESDGITRSDAEDFISNTRLAAHEKRLKLPKGRKLAMDLASAAEKYLERLEKEGGKDLDMKRLRLDAHIIPHLGKSILSNINVDRYKKDRMGEGASPGTINREIAVISHILTMAVKWGWLDKRPRIEKLKEGKGRIVYLSTEQVQRLMDAAWKHSPHVYLFCMIGLDTGMRRTEILSIRKEHIRIDKKIIYIPEAKAGPREQPITRRLAEYLKKWLDGIRDGSPWLFPARDGGHLHDIRASFSKVVKSAGLDPHEVTAHVMRHTAITHLVQDGVDLPTVMRVSGHHTLSMVLRYSHQDDPHITTAMDRLENRYTAKNAVPDYTISTPEPKGNK